MDFWSYTPDTLALVRSATGFAFLLGVPLKIASAAIEKNEWIVVAGWRPHWKFGRWDLKILKQDPDKTIWNVGNIHIQGRVNIDEDKPTLAQFLRNMYLTDPQLSNLMVKVEDSEYGVEEVTREWMIEHPEVVDQWIP